MMPRWSKAYAADQAGPHAPLTRTVSSWGHRRARRAPPRRSPPPRAAAPGPDPASGVRPTLVWLSDNGPQYTATATILYAHELGLVPITTPAYSPQSNGLAEAFVNTFKRDYVAGAELRDAESVLAQLSTSPEPTGSPTYTITIEIVPVVCFAAVAFRVLDTTITSTGSRTNSEAKSVKRSALPSEYRRSMRRF